MSDSLQDLAERHKLQLTLLEIEAVNEAHGESPLILIRLALYQLARLKIPVQTLLQDATRDTGIYQQHLQSQVWNLQQHPQLADAFQQVLTTPTQLEIEVAFKE